MTVQIHGRAGHGSSGSQSARLEIGSTSGDLTSAHERQLRRSVGRARDLSSQIRDARRVRARCRAPYKSLIGADMGHRRGRRADARGKPWRGSGGVGEIGTPMAVRSDGRAASAVAEHRGFIVYQLGL